MAIVRIVTMLMEILTQTCIEPLSLLPVIKVERSRKTVINGRVFAFDFARQIAGWEESGVLTPVCAIRARNRALFRFRGEVTGENFRARIRQVFIPWPNKLLYEYEIDGHTISGGVPPYGDTLYAESVCSLRLGSNRTIEGEISSPLGLVLASIFHHMKFVYPTYNNSG